MIYGTVIFPNVVDKRTRFLFASFQMQEKGYVRMQGAPTSPITKNGAFPPSAFQKPPATGMPVPPTNRPGFPPSAFQPNNPTQRRHSTGMAPPPPIPGPKPREMLKQVDTFYFPSVSNLSILCAITLQSESNLVLLLSVS